MSELTISQWINKQRQLQAQIRLGKPLEIAARTVHSMRTLRIFHEGKNSAGGSIGSYNRTKPLYVADKNLRRAGSHRGKTGKRIKTTAFQSYYALKRQQGFNPNIVNFRLTNDLQSDFANARLSKSNDSPPTSPPIKVSPQLWKEELRRQENVDKLTGLERKFGEVTAPTQEEKDTFQKVGNFEMMKLLKTYGW